mgnify:CR=1 FL=1
MPVVHGLRVAQELHQEWVFRARDGLLALQRHHGAIEQPEE